MEPKRIVQLIKDPKLRRAMGERETVYKLVKR
jgi:hypothetical protein